MRKRFVSGCFVAMLVAAFFGCESTRSGEKAKVEPAPMNGLYQRVGEQKLRAVVNDLVDASAKDPKVAIEQAGKAANWSATPENVADFKRGLFQFVAAATGGPQIYKGKDMATAHKGMNITDAQFDAMMSHLKEAMDKNKIAPEEQRELTQVFNGTRSAIVQQPK